MRLHGFYRSSAAYRVRIALNLKGLAHDHVFYQLRKSEQRAPDYVNKNPQGFVPSLELDDGRWLTQSLAMLEWLDENYPAPALLPKDMWERARVRSFALQVACDIHPVQNLKVLKRLRELGHAEPVVQEWANWVNAEGLTALEATIAHEPGPFCFGKTPSLADICLVPQMYNARRFKVDITLFPRLLKAEAACLAMSAFANAAPELQPDAEA